MLEQQDKTPLMHIAYYKGEKGQKKYLEPLENFINGDIDSSVKELIVNSELISKGTELQKISDICNKKGYKQILEFVNYSDSYLEKPIFLTLRKNGINNLLFRFEYTTEESYNYLMADKGLMCNVIKSILNASLYGFIVDISITPLKTNYSQLEDVVFLSKQIGINQIHLEDSKQYGPSLELSKLQMREMQKILKTPKEQFIRTVYQSETLKK